MNSKPDNLYVNLSFYYQKANIADPDIPCSFYVNRVTPVLENSEEYTMSIARLDIDSQNIPILIPSIQQGQSNINLTNYVVQINENGGAQGTPVNLVYVPKNKYGYNPPNVAGALSQYYWIYSVHDVVEMFNTACATAVSTFSGVSPPFMKYNGDNTFSIYFDEQFATNYSFCVNEYLYNLFRNFNYEYSQNNGVDYILRVTNQLSTNAVTLNSVNYLVETQTYPSMSVNWSPLSSIVITSPTLPIISEERVPTINILSGGSNSSNDLEAQLTDIVLSIDNPNDYNNQITYTATTNYRRCSLNAREIREISIQIYWRSKQGVLYPLLMSDGNAGTLKLKFEKA